MFNSEAKCTKIPTTINVKMCVLIRWKSKENASLDLLALISLASQFLH